MDKISNDLIEILSHLNETNDSVRLEDLKGKFKSIDFSSIWTILYCNNFIDGDSNWFKISLKGKFELIRLQTELMFENQINTLNGKIKELSDESKDRWKLFGWGSFITIVASILSSTIIPFGIQEYQKYHQPLKIDEADTLKILYLNPPATCPYVDSLKKSNH